MARLLLFILSILLFIVIIIQKKFRGWKKLLLAIVSLLLIGLAGFNFIFPLKPAPEPSGDKTVLTDTVYYRYKSDIADMNTHEDEREIPVSIWFPQGAEEASHPLLIFSHGSFGIAESNETMFLELASRGYIVMSLSHPYHSFTCTMSDGSEISVDPDFFSSAMSIQGSEDLEGTLKSLNEWSSVRIDDINIVMDQLLDSNDANDIEKYIDKDKIVLSGHSLGGSAALAVGRQRSQDINAMIILEAPFVSDIEGVEGDKYIFTDEDYSLPVLHVYSDAIIDRIDEITTYEMNARMIHANNPIYVNERIEGVGHLGLTDLALASPLITNLMDGGMDKRQAPETLLELNDYVIEFLQGQNLL